MKELIRVGLHGPRGLAVIGQHVLAHRGHDIQRRIPIHLLQPPVDADLRIEQPILSRRVGVVELEGQRAAAHGVVAALVDDFRSHGLAQSRRGGPRRQSPYHVMLVGADPRLQRASWGS